MNWQFDDGGRADAGYKGQTGDCVVRAIAIATGQPYRDVYSAIQSRMKGSEKCRTIGKTSPRTGVHKGVYLVYLQDIGWEWVATMEFGTGCTVHLRADELPSGPIIVRLSKHLCAVIDGVIRDTYSEETGKSSKVGAIYSLW